MLPPPNRRWHGQKSDAPKYRGGDVGAPPNLLLMAEKNRATLRFERNCTHLKADHMNEAKGAETKRVWYVG